MCPVTSSSGVGLIKGCWVVTEMFAFMACSTLDMEHRELETESSQEFGNHILEQHLQVKTTRASPSSFRFL